MGVGFAGWVTKDESVEEESGGVEEDGFGL